MRVLNESDDHLIKVPLDSFPPSYRFNAEALSRSQIPVAQEGHSACSYIIKATRSVEPARAKFPLQGVGFTPTETGYVPVR